MMKKFAIIVLLPILFLVTGCQKDIIGEEDDPITITTPPQELKLSEVSGIITNDNNDPLSDVIIKYNDVEYLSDENGYFLIPQTGIPSDGGILYISKSGYYDNYKFILGEAQTRSHIRVHMIEKNLTTTINAINGGEANLDIGAKIIFPERAFVDDNNVSYEGEVSIYAHWYDPSSQNLPHSMPGDLRGLSQEGKLVQLATYGMMAVELFTANGQSLQLGEGISATIEFPIPETLQNSAPETIVTWSLNEETVYWEEESTATLVDGKYIAEVTHFSFWNCDAPFPLVNIYGKLVNQDGQALPWHLICILAFNESMTGAGWTDSEGGFNGKIPKDEPLVMLIKDECGNVVFDQNIGPFSTDVSLGEITINSSGKTIFGTLVCNGTPITQGYALITIGDNVAFVAEVDENGYYELIIESCGLDFLTIQGFDIENGRTSEIIRIENLNDLDVFEIQALEVCEEHEEYIFYKIDGSPETFISDPSATIFDNNLRLSGEVPLTDYSISVTIENASIGDDNEIIFLEAILNNVGGGASWVRCDESNDCENVIFEITELGIEGQFVIGTFMGEAPNLQGELVSFMGSFKVIIDEIGNSSTVQGVVWEDEDKDGIRQNTEPLIEGHTIILVGPGSNSFRATTDENGVYSFDGITFEEFTLGANTGFGFSLTLANQGTDDSIDSDFENETEEINLPQGETLNFDLGLKTIGVLNCNIMPGEIPICLNENSSASIDIEVSGTPPFTVFLNGDIYETYDDETFSITELPFTYYTVEIMDAEDNVCSDSISLEIIDFLFCSIESTNSTAGSNTGSATVIVYSSLADSYAWSNGATTETITNLAPGAYSVTVTDIDGCTTECETVIEEYNFECEIFGPEQSCGGVVELTVESNINDVEYFWNNGSNGPVITVEPNITTTYVVTVTDSDGNTSICEHVIEVGSNLICEVTSNGTTCEVNNGSATVNVIGGSGAYTYIWSNGGTGQTIDGLAGDVSYSVTVTDAFGCSAVCETEVNDLGDIEVNVNLIESVCDDMITTTILEVIVNGGSGNYDYEWSDGGTEQTHTTTVDTEIELIVTDLEFGCEADTLLFIGQEASRIGDLVWLDFPGGDPDIYNEDVDEGLPNVLVRLYNALDPQNPIVIDSTLTNEFGLYRFDNLTEGQYMIGVELPNDLFFVEKDVEAEDIDSDVDPLTGLTDPIELDGCIQRLDIDVGLKEN